MSNSKQITFTFLTILIVYRMLLWIWWFKKESGGVLTVQDFGLVCLREEETEQYNKGCTVGVLVP